MELWNHVTMRYRRHDDGGLEPLPQPVVDTGMGLERLLTVLQGQDSVYGCDIFTPWLTTVSQRWPLDGPDTRVVCDHFRSCVVMLGDGVRPENTGRGYVLRRLLRRVLTTLWRDDPTRSLDDLPVEPVKHTLGHFRLPIGPGEVRTALLDEERRFERLLRRGRRVVSRRLERGPLREEDLVELHETHGLPRDLVLGLLVETR